MPDESETIYTVVIDGKPKGPYQLAELKALNIHAGTFIRKPDMDDYKEAHEFPELRELLGFKRQVTAPQYFASFDQRLLACVIDYFIIVTVYVVLVLLMFIFVADTERMIVSLMAVPLIPLGKLLYGTFAEAAEQQATIGKKLLNIKVTDLDGNRISREKSFSRNLAKILSVATLFIGYLYSFLNKKQQCLHDVVVGTLVIKDRLI